MQRFNVASVKTFDHCAVAFGYLSLIMTAEESIVEQRADHRTLNDQSPERHTFGMLFALFIGRFCKPQDI